MQRAVSLHGVADRHIELLLPSLFAGSHLMYRR